MIIVDASKQMIKNGKLPNLSILKKVFDDGELQFYFPNMFQNQPKPPVFIDKAHIGDTKIAGGDIVDGIKIIADRSTKVDNRGGLIQHSSIGGVEGRIGICPYCGKELNFPRPPRFCPYCKVQIMER